MGAQMLQELGTDNLMKLLQSKALVTGPSAPPGGQKPIPEEEEEVPELVGTFEDAAKDEKWSECCTRRCILCSAHLMHP